MPDCPACANPAYVYRHHRLCGDARRYPLPCPECQRGAYRIAPWIDATPGVCGGRPCFTGTRLDVRAIRDRLRSTTPEELAAEQRLPVAGIRAIKAVLVSGRYAEEFWEVEYDPRTSDEQAPDP